MKIINHSYNEYLISTDKEKMDIVSIHDFLSNHSGWSNGIPLNRVKLSVENSLNFGLFYNKHQVGYARVISDFSTIAYLGDVYVLENHRGKGLSKLLMKEIMEHPDLQGLRRWILLTSTAEWLYDKYNFKPLTNPEFYMELYNPRVYNAK
jgi:GNAT superfamily N-acetyltransferase